MPDLGTTDGGQTIKLGGFSGLWYEGMTPSGHYKFVTVPDRGPNGAPTDVNGNNMDERPFALPDYQAHVVRFTVNPSNSEFTIAEEIMLTRSDGATPISGLPNIPGVDETPVDLDGDLLPYDAFGADLEGIVVTDSGDFWAVDEYRPSIYHFDSKGKLIKRLVPVGTGGLAGEAPGTFGLETLPEGKKFVFEADLLGATNVLGLAFAGTLEQETADSLAAMDIRTVHKRKILNLPSIGYLAGD